MNSSSRRLIWHDKCSGRRDPIGLFLALALPLCLPGVLRADSVVVINEIMYHPRAGEPEWLELHNQMGTLVDLSDWSLAGGIEYAFPKGTILPPNSYVVVASSIQGSLRGSAGQVLGPFHGQFSNGGEEIRLLNNSGRLMNRVRYDDKGDWPVAPDGAGVSLAKIDPGREGGTPSQWTWSDEPKGTPGAANFENAAPPVRPLRFNEVSPAGDAPFFLEIVDAGTQPLAIGGAWIETQGSRDSVYTFKDGVLDPGAYIMVTQSDLGFAPAPGDRLFLGLAEGCISDAVRVPTAVTGRHPAGTGPWLFPAHPTPGQANTAELCTDIVINEIMYHPLRVPQSDTTDDESRTWVELYNKGTQTVTLCGWRFDKGISYTFPEGTTLAPDGYLVVARDRAYLASVFPDVPIVGDFEGRLANEGEELRLVDARGNPVDQVRYYSGGTWPAAANGGGSSLELHDPRADNNCGSAWGASDESARSAWQSFSYRGVVQASPVGNDNIYHEFVMGLLDAGEILIDDIHVIADPAGRPQELLQNCDFSRGLDHWRIIGSHRHSGIQPDPNDLGNPVLHLVATGPTEHMHNHAETTFTRGSLVSNGQEVEIRFRAKWISGSPLLHTRLFFNRLPRTTVLPTPLTSGTPGRRNSCHQSNIGPTLTDLQHTPAVPVPGEPVTVSVKADDPDGVAVVTLRYRPDNGVWQSTDMSRSGDRFVGRIPGHASHILVQFYAEAVDGQGFRARCPAAGADSFAQYRVLKIDSSTPARRPAAQATGPFAPRNTGVFNYRIVMRDEQTNFLFEPTNLMSNEHLGATLIVNEQDVYYNVGVRLKGSEHGRPQDPRIGFQLEFSPERLFRDVHRTIGFDRSDGQQTGQREMLLHAAMNRFGGFSKYHDVGYVIAPKQQYCSGIEVQLARYGPVYCREAYGDDGGSGTVFEYELVYTLAQTVGNDPEGLKIPQEGGGVYGRSVTDYLGTDKEKYRWHFLIKNNRDMDDYGPVIELTRTLSLSGSTFASAIPQTIDIDQWLRAFTVGSTYGVGDNWISNSQHNAMFYFRPTDARVLYFLHDLDYAYQQNKSLESNDVLRKLLQTPTWAHAFYGYVYGFLQTSFNRAYMSIWASHYAGLLPEQGWSGWLDYIDGRSQNVMGQVMTKAGRPVAFAITAPAVTIPPTGSALIRGRGWIDVQEVRVLETGQTLVLDWSDFTRWEAHLPADLAPGLYTLAAYDSQHELLATGTITLTTGR